jgi:Matrixin
MRTALRALAMATALAGLSPFASAYYFWTYFAGRSAPFAPIQQKFDLNPGDPYGLPNNTVTYLINQSGPTVLMPGDSFQAVVNTIRAAANVWNTVPTSAIQVTFGGLSPMTNPQVTPGIDVVFSDDIPPGLLAQTFQSTVNNPGAGVANGATFVPIIRPQVQLFSDLTVNQQSSTSDQFFLTIVHEFGHALGLQHTLTSSVMSTAITSATTKALPLAADDTVGVSLLYPANGFPNGTGSISGTVTLGGNGVNMASVVALATNGVAISGITNPDGTYLIQGIPPGQYFVYAQPLPAPASGEAYPDNLFPPQDPSGNPFLAFTSFGTQFLGGTTDWTQSSQVNVTAGNVANGVNISVPSRPGGPAVSGMTTYGYPGAGQVPVKAAEIQTAGSLVFTANGVIVNGDQVAPGLSLSVIGGAAYLYNPVTSATGTGDENSVSPVPLPGSNFYLWIGVAPYPGVNVRTPVAITATLNNDVYVLPAAFTVVPNPPPAITSVNGSTLAESNGTFVTTLNIQGANLGPSTEILFDSVPAISTTPNADGSLTVVAPPGSAGIQAAVEALNTDSQTSWQTLAGAPPMFTYGGLANPAVTLNPSSVAAGTSALVQVTGFNTNFVTGQMAVGFGSSDISVEHVWVVSPTQLFVNVIVSPNAAAQTTTVSVASGLALAMNAQFAVTPAVAGQISMIPPILNQATGLEGVPVGGTAVINTSGLPSNLGGWVLTIGNQQTSYTVNQNNQILAVVPGGALTGPAIVALIPPGGGNIPPVAMQIDIPPPVITFATDAGAAVTASNLADPGDTVTLSISGLANQSGMLPAPSAVIINVAGISTMALAVTQTGASTSLAQFAVPANAPGGAQPVTVQVGTRVSAAFTLNLQ